MAVNLRVPAPGDLHAVAGVELGTARAHIRKPGRRDLLVIRLAEGAASAGVFTRNRFCAAPVQVCREHLAGEGGSRVRALVVNTGCANAACSCASARSSSVMVTPSSTNFLSATLGHTASSIYKSSVAPSSSMIALSHACESGVPSAVR